VNFTTDILPLKDKLFRLALRITLDRDEAEDVVQDTLLRLWERRDELPQLQSIEAYSMTMCRNLALDRNKAARHSNLPLNEEQDSPIVTRTPLDELDDKQRMQQLMELINTLPEQQRSIILLRDVEGHSYEEIAQMLNIPLSQVKVYLHRARQRLKAAIEM